MATREAVRTAWSPRRSLWGAREVAQGQADQQGEHRAHQGQRQGHRKPEASSSATGTE